MTLIPWQAGRPVIWDVTVACTSADSYVEASAHEAGAAAEIAATRKTAKYADLTTRFAFEPIAVGTQGLRNESPRDLLIDMGRWISMSSGNDREVHFLFQRVQLSCNDLIALCCMTVFVLKTSRLMGILV